ncbi:hypothetical protein BaRGS_00020941 [Batillaria attramentaria]|uniref:Uncharacterized protein n=1 Tax=Batillaria attramentaria TaxID=370345 RepID=A0ABD0KKT4_9CAEN
MVDSHIMTKCVVLLGGCTEVDKPLVDVVCLPVSASKPYKGYSFKAVPEACGFNFATCKWRNELYVCGGSQNPTFFAKYKPGDDEWEVLPALPQGREGHVMVAVSGNIYVIGGLEEDVVVKKSPASDVMVYNTKTKDWGRKGRLFMAVQDASAAALGHRIYVFGGREAGGNPVDTVQCVDTVTGCVYEAGHLPSPTTGARAVSDGGTITIATTDCHVLKMKEDFILADRRERQLAAEKTKKSGNKGGGDDAISPTVTFIQVGEFPKRTEFGVFLDREELVVCGGQAEDGQLLDDITGIHLESGVVTNRKQKLHRGTAQFGLQVLHMPNDFLSSDRATIQPFDVGDRVRVNPATWTGQFPRIQHPNYHPVQQNGHVTVDFPQYQGWTCQMEHLILA